MALEPIRVELTYTDGTKREIELAIDEEYLPSGDGLRSYPGVVMPDEDFDAQCVAYGLNEGRATHCDCRPWWAAPLQEDDEPEPVDLASWRVIAGVELLLEYGIVDRERPPCSGDVIERAEDVDTNEPGDLSPADERLAAGLRPCSGDPSL